jgi:hypothetical protein
MSGNYMKKIYKILLLLFFTASISFAQEGKINPAPMHIDVGNFNLKMIRLNGDGGLQSQFSWNLTGDNRQNTEIFYWPQDRWQSNMLYQILNPVVLVMTE